MMKTNKTLIIVVAAVAALLAIYSGWKVFGGQRGSAEQQKNTKSGPINSMSSMFGPDASGRPRTQRPAEGTSTAPSGPAPDSRGMMMGRGPAGRQ
jgi:hypothetical protein